MHNVKHYLSLDGEQRGPYTFSQLQGMWRNGVVTSETMHFMDGYADWMPLDVIVQDLEPSLPPPLRAYHATQAPRPMVVAKSRGVYIILALFLGGLFGIHNFYAGRFGIAVAQLVITIFTGWLILPLLAVVVWVLIECIVVRVATAILWADLRTHHPVIHTSTLPVKRLRTGWKKAHPFQLTPRGSLDRNNVNRRSD